MRVSLMRKAVSVSPQLFCKSVENGLEQHKGIALLVRAQCCHKIRRQLLRWRYLQKFRLNPLLPLCGACLVRVRVLQRMLGIEGC